MLSTPSHLGVLFCVTAGQNGENLGSDEEQIVAIVFLLYDVANNKIAALQHHYVRPTADDITEPSLTEECKIQTGLTEDAIKNAQPLDYVLDELDRFLSSKEVHPDHGGKPFTLTTDGQLHLRLCLLPEVTRKNVTLPHYFGRFFDIRKEFKRYYKCTNALNCIKDMLDFLGMEADHSVDYGVSQAQDMANIIHRLITDGHQFVHPEIIKQKLEPGICSRAEFVDDDTVIRARGLPWQSSDQDIAQFFHGLNVAKGGVALCLSQQGRRNGEALIRFDNKENRDLALRKHKHHLGQRYIEVYKASGKDFINIAGGSSSEAQAFLSRHNGHGGQVIVRMRGLPYTCTTQQVLDFFRSGDQPIEVLDRDDGILFVHQADGRATGDAFVLFATEDEAGKALLRHRDCIGSRYIELFKSTTAEVQQVLNRSLDPRNPAEAEPQLPLISQLPQTSPIFFPQQVITSGMHRDCIRLRGLPFEASVTDILTFLGEHARNIVFQGVHMVYNAQGTPSGEAFIQMDGELSSESASINKHKKFMFIGNKKRYIEVLQCSGEDMNMVLSSGLAQAAMQAQIPTLAAAHQTATIMPPPHSAIAPTTALFQRPQLLSPAGISPGSNIFPQQTIPYGAIPYGHAAAPPQPFIAATAGLQTPTSAISNAITAASLAPPITTAIQPRPGMPYGYQPMLYWYPSPPVSPQSTFYVQSCPTTIVMKGLPFTASLPEIMAFFDGIFEQLPPDIQLQRGADGRPTGEAYITFGSRAEAERAITERNRKVLGNRYVELHMA